MGSNQSRSNADVHVTHVVKTKTTTTEWKNQRMWSISPFSTSLNFFPFFLLVQPQPLTCCTYHRFVYLFGLLLYFLYQALATPTEVSIRKVKVVVFGSPKVGKTSLVERWIHNSFDPDPQNYKPTHQLMMSSKFLSIENTLLCVEVWDTPSQPDLRDTYVSHTHSFFLSLIVSAYKSCLTRI